jgi:hypothetical protein
MNLAGNISRSPITMRCTQVFSTNKTVRHDITEKIVESGINIDSPFSHYLTQTLNPLADLYTILLLGRGERHETC